LAIRDEQQRRCDEGRRVDGDRERRGEPRNQRAAQRGPEISATASAASRLPLASSTRLRPTRSVTNT
jgi:hypothetical protein